MLLWINAGLTILCLFLAWLIVKITVSHSNERKGVAFAVFIMAFGALGGFLHNLIIPKISANYAASKLEEGLLVNPAFAALKQYDATGFAALVIPLKQQLRDGRSHKEVAAAGTNVALKMVQNYVSQASDATAYKYMNNYVQMLTTVQEKDLEACYAITHGSSDGQYDLTKFITPQQIDAQYLAMAEVIRSYATERQAVPTEADIQDQLQPLAQELVRLYGKDILMLSNPSGPKADKKRMCQMEMAWLRLALRQPPEVAGKLMRFLVSKV
jgi:hypothetical protein